MTNKLINVIVTLVSSAVIAVAGEKNVVVPVETPSSVGVTVKAFAASVIEDTDTYAVGGGVSLEVPIVYNLKLEAVGSLFEDELYTAGANLLYYIPVTEAFSVYAIGGGSYEFETDQWTAGAGAGLKYALSSQFSVFADGVYNWTVENDSEDGVVTARVGIGFSF